MAHERSCFWQNIVSEETCEHHSEIRPTYPARLTQIFDDEPSASEWGPRRGFKNDKAQCW